MAPNGMNNEYINVNKNVLKSGKYVPYVLGINNTFCEVGHSLNVFQSSQYNFRETETEFL